MVDRETIQNMQSSIPKNKFENLLHLVSFLWEFHWWCVSHAAAIKLAAQCQQFADKDLKHI